LSPTPRHTTNNTNPPTRIIGVSCIAATLSLITAHPSPGASAEVSEVVAKVSVSQGNTSQPASVGDTVAGNTALRTGTKSRAELTFEDSTLLRVGSNTIFSFAEKQGKGKGFTMTRGTAFIATPKGKAHGGVYINCGGVTAAITGSSSTVSNTDKGVGMFAATGDNYLIIDGNWIKVEPFTFTYIPWKKDASGKKVPDLDNKITKSYDALAQIDSGWVSENLSKDIRERIIAKKKELFGAGQLSNAPNTGDDNPVIDTTRTFGGNTPPPGRPNVGNDNAPR
jgi:hypothetical protein